jgi:hypothetical protein
MLIFSTVRLTEFIVEKKQSMAYLKGAVIILSSDYFSAAVWQ